MTTIKLKVSDRILERLLKILGQFRSEDIEVIVDNEGYQKSQELLNREFRDVESERFGTLSLEEFSASLEETIREYENKGQ